MAASSLLTLIDDIATLLDDVAVLTKVASSKTAGVLGDDLALNAKQLTGINADRELPIVWAVAKGSLLNKCILLPAALLISFFLPQAITPLLMLGGCYLCFEGCEKLAHRLLHSRQEDQQHHQQLLQAISDEQVDLVAFEQDKIKGAIRTDFILSAEIIAIALGSVAHVSFFQQVIVLVMVALLITVGVYGIVAAIVKLDDAGLYLCQRASTSVTGQLQSLAGKGLLALAPALMKFLSVAGTIAMFMVGGGIIVHGLPGSHHWLEQVDSDCQQWLEIIPATCHVLPACIDILTGLLTGVIVLAIVMASQKLLKKS